MTKSHARVCVSCFPSSGADPELISIFCIMRCTVVCCVVPTRNLELNIFGPYMCVCIYMYIFTRKRFWRDILV